MGARLGTKRWLRPLGFLLLYLAVWPSVAETTLYSQSRSGRARLLQQEPNAGPSLPESSPSIQPQQERNMTYYVEDEVQLRDAVATSSMYTRVVIILPPRVFTLDSPLDIFTPTELHGSVVSGSVDTVLRCGKAGIGLLAMRGSELALTGVRLEGCSRPGIVVISKDAKVTIDNCAFVNFTRGLAAGRLSTLDADKVSPISSETAALAIHAPSFAGSLSIRQTIFSSNEFYLDKSFSGSSRRRLGGRTHDLPTGEAGVKPRDQSHSRSAHIGFCHKCIEKVGCAECSMESGFERGRPRALNEPVFNLTNHGRSRRTLQQDSKGRSNPVLSRARSIHPQLQEGPWADDVEAVIAVLCADSSVSGPNSAGPSPTCAVSLDQVTLSDNTGVATGALYLLCDGMARCDFTLTDCTVERNKLLWQAAADKHTMDRDWDPAQLSLTEHPEYDYDAPSTPAMGVDLLKDMVPWLMYTYPLIEWFKEMSQTLKEYEWSGMGNAANYPTVTGRTLGAVVIHQRNAPAVALPPGAAAMASVSVTGGSYSNNDGSGIMSTVTDWQSLAGGNGSWSGGLPRHSADFTLTGVQVEEHTSGWPAVWLRWPRRATVTDCTVQRSTGALWLDEVRDLATLQNSRFVGNTLNQPWLDYTNFVTEAPTEGFEYNFQLGVGVAHNVKLQMTPLGSLDNHAVVTGCSFEDNRSFLSGSLYIVASDKPVDRVNVDELPGSTAVSVTNTNFTRNVCRRSPDVCKTGERPLYIKSAAMVNISSCRFDSNTNGGAYVDIAGGFEVKDSTFSNNTLTFVGHPSDPSNGGAALFAYTVGSQGASIISSTFTDNVVATEYWPLLGGGGAVQLSQYASALVHNCRFTSNRVLRGNGGALLLSKALQYQTIWNETYITDSNFTDNSAGGGGGAVMLADIISPGLVVVQGCRFERNEAMLDIAGIIRAGMIVTDLAGGGSILGTSVYQVAVINSVFLASRVIAHLGGAAHFAECGAVSFNNVLFAHSSALSGGALALTRLVAATRIEQCVFTNNSVVESWSWPATTTVPGVRAALSPNENGRYVGYWGTPEGYGGAIFTNAAGFQIIGAQTAMTYNKAVYGGAVASLASVGIRVSGQDVPGRELIFSVPVASTAGSLTGAAYRYKSMYAHNVALLGGAIYLSETKEYCDIDDKVLFFNNTASGGGAFYIQAAYSACLLQDVLFLGNNAQPPPYAGLYGPGRDSNSTANFPCSGGGGGAVCIAAKAGSFTRFLKSTFSYNRAKDGGALALAEGTGCIVPARCYRVLLDNCTVTENTASGRGGAVFMPHEGLLETPACLSDRRVTLQSAIPASTDSAGQPPASISVLVPQRTGPTESFQQLPESQRQTLLKSLGGPVDVTKSPAFATAGNVSLAVGTILAMDSVPSGTVITEAGDVVAASGAYLTQSGRIVLQPEPGAVPVEGMPVVFSSTPVNDTDWFGVPYKYLPCADWSNAAVAGKDIATGPFYLLTASLGTLDFYSSNTDIHLPVTVHDFYGQLCEGDETVQPPVVVRANSNLVSGQTETRAVNGTAHFQSLRLRSPEGLQSITFTGLSFGPLRDLKADKDVRVYVRPCSINEFLSTKGNGECVACCAGSYNFNTTAATCQECPENAECGNPDPASCQMEDCEPEGFLVPQEGYWHSNFFSEQILECPNPDACASDDRSDAITALQVKAWEMARDIQVNASAPLLVSGAPGMPAPRLRQLLQGGSTEPATTQLYYEALVNATLELLPEYMSAQCADGYEGPLCGVCKPGYGWSDVATCVKCPNKALNSLFYALVTLATAAMLIFTIKTTLKEQPRHGRLVAGMDDDDDAKKKKEKKEEKKGKKKQKKRADAKPSSDSATDDEPMDRSVRFPDPVADPHVVYAVTSADAAPLPPGSIGVDIDNSKPPVAHYVVAPLSLAQQQQQSQWAPQLLHASTGSVLSSLASQDLMSSYVHDTEPIVSIITSDEPPSAADATREQEQQQAVEDAGLRPDSQALGTDFSDWVGIDAVRQLGYDQASLFLEGSVLGDQPHAMVGGMGDTLPYMDGEAVEVTDAASGAVSGATSDADTQAAPQPFNMPSAYGPIVYGPDGPTHRWTSGPVHKSSDEYNSARPRARQATIVKMFVTYMQVLGLIRVMPLDIPRVMDVYYRINSQVTSFPGNLVSLDCSLPDTPGVSSAMTRTILSVLSPLYVCAAGVIFMLMYDAFDYTYCLPRRYAKRKKQRPPPIRVYLGNRWGRQCIVTTIVVIFFFYPSVVQSLFSIFSCQDIDSPDGANPLAEAMGLQTQRVWSQDFTQECYKGAHLALALGLGIPGFVIIAVGWPVVFALMVSKTLGRFKWWPTLRFTEDVTELCLTDFKERYVWWDSVVMMRKLAIAAIVTFVGTYSNVGVQLLVVMCILALAMAAQAICMPYHHLYTNVLEQVATSVLMLNLYLSLYIETGVSGGGRIAVSVLILALNIATVVAFLYYIAEAYWFSVLYETGLIGLDSDKRKDITAAEVRQIILDRILKRKRKGDESDDEAEASRHNSGITWSDSGRSSYQHHIATVYATAVVAGLRIGHTTERMLTKVRSLRSTTSSDINVAELKDGDKKDAATENKPSQQREPAKRAGEDMDVEYGKSWMHFWDRTMSMGSGSHTPASSAGDTSARFTSGHGSGPRSSDNITLSRPASARIISESPVRPPSSGRIGSRPGPAAPGSAAPGSASGSVRSSTTNLAP